MDNIIIIALVLLIVTLAGAYVYREKKKGQNAINRKKGMCC